MSAAARRRLLAAQAGTVGKGQGSGEEGVGRKVTSHHGSKPVIKPSASVSVIPAIVNKLCR